MYDKEKLGLEFSAAEKVEYAKYILQLLLPYLKQLNEEQMMEKEIEAKLKCTLMYSHFVCRSSEILLSMCFSS